jgi:thiamine biosynthesis protein ThiI
MSETDHNDLPDEPHLMVHLSGEIHIKSARTRRRFRRLVLDRVRGVLKRTDSGARLIDIEGRVHVAGDTSDSLAESLSHLFGVHRITRVDPIPFEDLDGLADAVYERCADRVRDRIFAVRVRRRGRHPWSSETAQRTIGGKLYDLTRGVDLKNPEVAIQLEIYDNLAYLIAETWAGPSGLPSGSQERCLSLMSGGFDSPVAAWLMMRRGCPVDFVHFKLECSASEHATLVTHTLWERWGAGTNPVLWMVDFQPVKEALLEHVDSSLRQVVLKQLMFATADRLAERLGIHVLVTGEAVGQVSSQTMSHLAAIDTAVHRTVLRPLAGALKEEIIDRARSIGTEAVSARAVEVCDLSDGPVAVTARWKRLAEAHEGLPEGLVDDALASLEVIALRDWFPGAPFARVVDAIPADRTRVDPRDGIPEEGNLAICGSKGARVGSSLVTRGRDVVVVLEDRSEEPGPSASPCL